MPIVKMPDGQDVSFPDDMPKEQIRSLIATKFPELAQAQPPEGIAASAGHAFGEGLANAVPFGQKITSGLGAVGAKAYDKLSGENVTEGISIPELYNQAQQNYAATSEAHPLASLAGSLTGIAGTVPLAFSKNIIGAPGKVGKALDVIPQALQKIGKFASTGNLASRAAKGALVTAPAGALYGAGEAKPGEMLEGAKYGAGLGAVAGAALPVGLGAVGGLASGTKNLIKGIGSRGVKALETNLGAIKQSSSAAYTKMRELNATLTPEASNEVLNDIKKTISEDGLLNTRLHTQTVGLIEDFEKRVGSGEPLGLEELDQWRQLFGDAAGRFTEPADARKASMAIEALDEAVEKIGGQNLANNTQEALDALKLGRSEWRRARKFETIADIIKKADGDANALKRGLKSLADNKKKTRGFTTAEILALQDTSRNSAGEAILKMLGRFGFDLGSGRAAGTGVGAIVGGGVGFGFGGAGLGLTVPALGTVARSAQKWIAKGKVEKLLSVIEEGGKPSAKEINALPVEDAQKINEIIKQKRNK